MVDMPAKNLTILHVEDDAALARLVQITFRSFGFLGEIVSAGSVREIKELLLGREGRQQAFSLIITDMVLPDGTGLDVIREVRTSSAWRLTPLLVLSGETNEKTINSAYALGANCYLPKFPKAEKPLAMLRNLYQCWMKNAHLPRTGPGNRLQAILERAIEIRARTSEFYLKLADAFQNDPEEMEFWLNRALMEGNLLNLIAFFLNKFDGISMDTATLERLETVQIRTTELLWDAERQLQESPSPHPATACQWGLTLTDAMDESVFAEALGALFPVSSVATLALKIRVAMQLREIARHALDRVQEPEPRQKANALSQWAQRLMTEGTAGQCTHPEL